MRTDSHGKADFLQWAVLYVSGLLLVALVGVHVWAVHYAGDVSRAGYSFAGVAARFQHPFYRAVDLLLLFLALAHGLVGTQRVIIDLDLVPARAIRLVNGALVLLGVVGCAYGWLIYRAFLR